MSLSDAQRFFSGADLSKDIQAPEAQSKCNIYHLEEQYEADCQKDLILAKLLPQNLWGHAGKIKWRTP